MRYPGYVIQQGEYNATLVRAVQQQLNSKGCGSLTTDGFFGEKTFNAVQLFQSRFQGSNGIPLVIDGVVGPVTWAALFGPAYVGTIATPPNPLLAEVLAVAASKIGVIEIPAGSNSGTDVNVFQDAAGIPHGSVWSMAFIYWCFETACTNLGIANPMLKTGSVIEQWRRTNGTKILATNAQHHTSLLQPGQIFIISTGGGAGHAGLVEKIENGLLTTIEGGTNEGNSIGVFRRIGRTIGSVNEGFVQY